MVAFEVFFLYSSEGPKPFLNVAVPATCPVYSGRNIPE
jgi:hypothetical protein